MTELILKQVIIIKHLFFFLFCRRGVETTRFLPTSPQRPPCPAEPRLVQPKPRRHLRLTLQSPDRHTAEQTDETGTSKKKKSKQRSSAEAVFLGCALQCAEQGSGLHFTSISLENQTDVNIDLHI